MNFTGLVSKSRILKYRGFISIDTYRDGSLYEFVAHPRLQHVIVPVEKEIGVKSELSPDCRSVFMHMSDPLKFLNGDAPYAPIVTIDDLTPKGKVLRGSGLHGPERTDVTRLVLYNRLKERRMQRVVPSESETKDDFYFCMSYFWLIGSFMVGLCILNAGEDYARKYGHFPWVPARADGTLGPGKHTWYTI